MLGWLVLNAAFADTRRFALIAGANDGGADRVELQYAITDATALSDVLAELGGVPRSNQTMLVEPTAEVLRNAIDSLSQTVARAESVGMRTEVVFYYSGHSDETGLLLGESRYGFPDLKRDLEAIPSDVKVVILDSCASGALVRTKGGVVGPAFLEDKTNDVEGTAYVMSSAADEASQESDVVGASYFTHFLVSGMRGAADRSSDGRVTLHEAWDFASRETLERTERTSIGAQHPFFHRDLGGHGDFVFTDLTHTTSSLVFDDSMEGRLFVRDADGDLVAELAKPVNESVELALGAGTYTVVLQQGTERYESVFDIGPAEHLMVDDLEFTAIETEVVRARGGVPQPKVVLPNPNTPRPPPPPPEAPAPAPQPPETPQATDVPETDPVDEPVNPQVPEGQPPVQVAMVAQAEAMKGAQLGVIASVLNGASIGVQISTFVNVANDALLGAQLGLINGGRDVRGAQIGLVNHARDGKGLQLGLVNSGGDGEGLQLGLINVARDYDGAALGLINLHKAGYNHFHVMAGAPENLLLSVSFGSRYVYTTAHVGSTIGKDRAGVSMAGGVGLHLPKQRVYFDLEMVGGWRIGELKGTEPVQAGIGQPMVRSRLHLGAVLAKHFALQGGLLVELYPSRSGLQAISYGDELLIGGSLGFRI